MSDWKRNFTQTLNLLTDENDKEESKLDIITDYDNPTLHARLNSFITTYMPTYGFSPPGFRKLSFLEFFVTVELGFFLTRSFRCFSISSLSCAILSCCLATIKIITAFKIQILDRCTMNKGNDFKCSRSSDHDENLLLHCQIC